MIYSTTELPRLTTEEEVAIILNDIFDGDVDTENIAIQELANSAGIDFPNQEELNELIIKNEDALYERYLPRQD
jgi:hypothetical protein